MCYLHLRRCLLSQLGSWVRAEGAAAEDLTHLISDIKEVNTSFKGFKTEFFPNLN